MSLPEFREAMRQHAQEIIEEMEEDHLNPVAAFVEQMQCRRMASRLLRQHEEALVREVLQALSEVEGFPPARWLWNAAHPHMPLHAFFRHKREPVFRITALEAMPQVVSLTVEHGLAEKNAAQREEMRFRRDRRGRLGLEYRRVVRE